jgi:hypothetical protein
LPEGRSHSLKSIPSQVNLTMFMRNNRKLNGAPQPEQVASREAPDQRSQGTLIPNPTDLGSPQHRTFEPNLETEEAINRRHYRGGLDDGEWPDYEQHIPHGPLM